MRRAGFPFSMAAREKRPPFIGAPSTLCGVRELNICHAANSFPKDGNMDIRRTGIWYKEKEKRPAKRTTRPLFCSPFCGTKEKLAAANFYVSLTAKPDFAASVTGFRATERELSATGIGSGATGILAVFPTCTSRRHYMYI